MLIYTAINSVTTLHMMSISSLLIGMYEIVDLKLRMFFWWNQLVEDFKLTVFANYFNH